MATTNDVTKEEIRLLFDYNLDTGEFTRKISRGLSGRSKVGQVAGYTNKDGYKFIRINDKLYRSHRLAWLYVYGYFPKEIDHIDNRPSNNAIKNLRECTSSQNKFNTRLRKDSTSKVKGLHWYKAYQKWQVNLRINGKTKCLGYFEDLFEACCTVMSNRNKHHGEFANHGYY